MVEGCTHIALACAISGLLMLGLLAAQGRPLLGCRAPKATFSLRAVASSYTLYNGQTPELGNDSEQSSLGANIPAQPPPAGTSSPAQQPRSRALELPDPDASGKVQTPAYSPSTTSQTTPTIAAYSTALFKGFDDPPGNDGVSSIMLHDWHSGSLWWADMLLASRLYSPSVKMAVVTDRAEAVRGHSTVGPAFTAASISVAAAQELGGPGSRGAAIMVNAERYWGAYLKTFLPRHTCALGMGSQACQRTAWEQGRMVARFCWQADLANREGVDYVMTMDADVMLTSDLANLTSPLGRAMLSADIVTFTEWSSQVVLWRREALDLFCDAAVEHSSATPEEMWHGFHVAADVMGQHDGRQIWTDMHLLAAFLRVLRPELPRIVLCGTPQNSLAEGGQRASQEVELCRRLVWKLANGAGWLPDRNEAINMGLSSEDIWCQKLEEFVEWRVPNASSSAALNSTDVLLPELWTRWTFYDMPPPVPTLPGLVPRRHGPPERAPLVHFRGGCKAKGSALVHSYFVQPGLTPNLSRQGGL